MSLRHSFKRSDIHFKILWAAFVGGEGKDSFRSKTCLSTFMRMRVISAVAKAKQSLYRSIYRPLGFQQVEAPRCQDSRHMKVVKLSSPRNGFFYPPRKYSCYSFLLAAGIAQSIQRLATGWTVRKSNPGGGENFRTRPDRTWRPSSLLYNEHLVFPGGKATGTWCWPPTPIVSA